MLQPCRHGRRESNPNAQQRGRSVLQADEAFPGYRSLSAADVAQTQNVHGR